MHVHIFVLHVFARNDDLFSLAELADLISRKYSIVVCGLILAAGATIVASSFHIG